MKVLISWNATNNDFFLNDENKPTAVDPDGVHGEFYQNFKDYDEHYLLNTGSEEKGNVPFAHLTSHLGRFDTIKVLPKYMEIDDPSDVGQVKLKITPLLLQLKDHQVEVYISPGTPAMQTVWYLMGQENTIDLRLFKITPPKHRKTSKPTRKYIEYEFDNVATTSYILEHNHRKKSQDLKEDPIINSSNQESFDRALKVASMDDTTALILGETGTGKEVIAKYIHTNSSRAGKPFKAFNCASFSDELLESRLFGHEKGAFTGALYRHDGIFTQAHTGTVFLDEIGDISKKMQVTLLRVLQERTVNRLGGKKSEKVDVRVIAATNNELWKKVQNGEFRADLFFRLAVAEIPLTPLRKFTKKDKLKLFDSIHYIVADNLKRTALKIDAAVIDALLNYDFPGNIRELIHWFERWFTYCKGRVKIRDFSPLKSSSENTHSVVNLKEAEKIHIQKVLNMYKGRTKKSLCDDLGIRFETLNSKLEKYSLTFEGK